MYKYAKTEYVNMSICRRRWKHICSHTSCMGHTTHTRIRKDHFWSVFFPPWAFTKLNHSKYMPSFSLTLTYSHCNVETNNFSQHFTVLYAVGLCMWGKNNLLMHFRRCCDSCSDDTVFILRKTSQVCFCWPAMETLTSCTNAWVIH